MYIHVCQKWGEEERQGETFLVHNREEGRGEENWSIFISRAVGTGERVGESGGEWGKVLLPLEHPSALWRAGIPSPKAQS